MRCKEIWKDILNYEGIYLVSNYGRVVSLKKGWRILKPRDNQRGYKFVTLWKNGIRVMFYVHRLVLIAFLGPSELEANHKDNDRSNNALSNLEWVSKSKNNLQRWKNMRATNTVPDHSNRRRIK